MLLSVLDEEGDLGTLTVDTNLIKSWATYLDGRGEVERLLSQIWHRLEGFTLDAMKKQYGRKFSLTREPEKLVRLYRRGRHQQIVVQRDQISAYLGFCVPAIAEYGPIWISIRMEAGVPVFRIEVQPWDVEGRKGKEAKQLAAASKRLADARFVHSSSFQWTRDFQPGDWLFAADVPETLVALAENSLAAIVESRVLDLDLELGLNKIKGNTPPRLKKLPSPPE